MKLIMFTKHLAGRDINGLIKDIKSVGAEGADLCVRPGFPVEPETALKTLPPAVKSFQNEGLSIPIITTPGDFTDPKTPLAEKVFEACDKSGVRLMKLGYWFMEKDRYWKTIDKVRRDMEGFSQLAEKYKVKACIHNHSGGTMGLNSCSVMNIVKGFDPKFVGVFADPGHLSIVGEPLPMAFSIVEEYLSIVAVKDVIRDRYIQDGKSTWQIRVVPLGEGYVNWHDFMKILLEKKFDGPISMHSEYSQLEVESVIDQTRMDIRFFHRLMSQIQQEIKTA